MSNSIIRLGYKDAAWFSDPLNAGLILEEGQHVYLEQTGTYKIGDGVTALSALSFLGGTQGVQSVTGNQVDNTDPLNPIINNELTDSNFGDFVQNLSTKATPINNDTFSIYDSVAGIAKKITFTILKSFLKTYFDTIYTTTAAVASQITTALSGYLSLTGGTLTGLLKQAKSTDIAGGTTIDLSTATGNEVHVTGSGWTCTSFGTETNGTQFIVIFDGTGVLTYNATSLILPGGANITTAAGDSALFVSEGGGNWKCMFYQSAGSTIGTWSPSWTGFSSNPNTIVAEYSLVGDICTVWLYAVSGTSNTTAKTVTLPFAAKYGYIRSIVNITNSGTNAAGLVQTTASSNILTCYATAAGGTWTPSGNATVSLGGFTYRIA